MNKESKKKWDGENSSGKPYKNRIVFTSTWCHSILLPMYLPTFLKMNIIWYHLISLQKLWSFFTCKIWQSWRYSAGVIWCGVTLCTIEWLQTAMGFYFSCTLMYRCMHVCMCVWIMSLCIFLRSFISLLPCCQAVSQLPCFTSVSEPAFLTLLVHWQLTYQINKTSETELASCAGYWLYLEIWNLVLL